MSGTDCKPNARLGWNYRCVVGGLKKDNKKGSMGVQALGTLFKFNEMKHLYWLVQFIRHKSDICDSL